MKTLKNDITIILITIFMLISLTTGCGHKNLSLNDSLSDFLSNINNPDEEAFKDLLGISKNSERKLGFDLNDLPLNINNIKRKYGNALNYSVNSYSYKRQGYEIQNFLDEDGFVNSLRITYTLDFEPKKYEFDFSNKKLRQTIVNYQKFYEYVRKVLKSDKFNNLTSGVHFSRQDSPYIGIDFNSDYYNGISIYDHLTTIWNSYYNGMPDYEFCVEVSGFTFNNEQKNNKNTSANEIMDDNFDFITNFEFDEAGNFNEKGRAVVSKGNKQYVIDVTGKTISEFKFGKLFKEKYVKRDGYYAVVSDDYEQLVTDYIIEDNGQPIFDIPLFGGDDVVEIKSDGKFGLVDRNKGIVLDVVYDEIESSRGDGEKIFKLIKDNKIGYADEKGKIICNCMYDAGSGFSKGSWFSDGLCEVKLNGKSGYINKKGNVVIDFMYSEGGKFSEGLAFVKQESDQNYNCGGYIDKLGNQMTNFEYSNGETFCDGLAFVEKYDNPHRYDSSRSKLCIDTNGNIKFLVKDGYCSHLNSDLLYWQTSNNNSIVNRNGTSIINLETNEIDNLDLVLLAARKNSNFFIIHGSNNKFWLIDSNGNKISKEYDRISRNLIKLADGFNIEQDGKIGYINHDGKVIIECIANSLSMYGSGYGIMTISDEKYLINDLGKKILKCEEIDSTNLILSDNKLPIKVKKNGKYGYILLKKDNKINVISNIDSSNKLEEELTNSNFDYKLFENSYNQYESRIKELGSELVKISEMPDTGGTYKIYKTKNPINYEDKTVELVLCFMFSDNGKEFLYSIKFVETFEKDKDSDFIVNSVKAFNNNVSNLSGYEKLSCYIDEPRQDYDIETDEEELNNIITNNKIQYNDYTDILNHGIVNAYYNDGYIDNFVSLYPYLDDDNVCSKIYLVNGLSVSSEYFNQLMGYN